MSKPLRRAAAPLPVLNVSSTAIKMAELAIAQGAVFAFPLVFAVVCARTLGPANYGVVAFYTALTSFLGMVVEFGFDSIGVREVHAAGRRQDPSQVVWNVTLAKLTVCLATSSVAVSVLLMIRGRAESSMVWAMVLYLVAFALDTNWYLRSLELTRTLLAVAVVSRMVGIAFLIYMVRGSDDLHGAMWSYAFVAWANALAGWMLMHRLRVIGRVRLDVPHLRALFSSGGSIVIGNVSATSLTNGGIVLLGALADPALTGAANLALRIRTAGQAVVQPLSQLGFVRLSGLVASDRGAAIVLGRRLLYALLALSMTVSILIIVNADTLTALAYGHSQAPASAAMLVRILAIGLPVSVAAHLLLQCLTLVQQERAYVSVLVFTSLTFVGVLFLTNAGYSVNYGWALLAADALVALAAGLCLRRVARRT